MDTINHQSLSQARTIRNTIVTAIDNHGRSSVAKLLDVDVSYIAKLISDNSEHKMNFKALSQMLSEIGLKVVPKDFKCVDPKKHQLLIDLAGLGADAIRQDINFDVVGDDNQ